MDPTPWQVLRYLVICAGLCTVVAVGIDGWVKDGGRRRMRERVAWWWLRRWQVLMGITAALTFTQETRMGVYAIHITQAGQGVYDLLRAEHTDTLNRLQACDTDAADLRHQVATLQTAWDAAQERVQALSARRPPRAWWRRW